jgi:hypothetical protein
MPRSTNSIIALPPEALAMLKNLGVRLRARRLAQNMTLEHAAERLLCSPTTYSLGLLAHALWLFGRLEDMEQLSPLDIGMLSNKRSQRARPVVKGIGNDERDF